jgi:AcrR family transcriptional regulator
MRANGAIGERARTFTEVARRAQIVAAAIETIAEVGYAKASLARIAKRAGLSSTGLITYHFAGKDELIQEVVADVYGAISGFMTERMQGSSGAAGALRTYLESTVEFIGAHRTQMMALLDIFLHGGFHYDTTAEQTVVSPIAAILRQGQEAGEFRDFDPTVMATVIQRAVDGLPFLLASTPDLDLDGYARELVTMFNLATQRSER